MIRYVIDEKILGSSNAMIDSVVRRVLDLPR
jgi:hypothetical protein